MYRYISITLLRTHPLLCTYMTAVMSVAYIAAVKAIHAAVHLTKAVT
jgi:hypothetical protein